MPPKGTRHSPETKERLRLIAQSRPPVSEQTRAKMSAAGKGKKHSPEHIRKVALANSLARKGKPGRQQTPEECAKRSATLKGRTKSPEHRAKIAASLKGRVFPHQLGRTISEETRTRLSVAMKGRKHTDEHRAKISAGLMGNTYKLGYKDPPEIRWKKHLARLGENNPAWRGGISYFPYPIAFNDSLKRRIRKLFSYSCFDCGRNEERLTKRLDVHHVDSDKHNLSVENLVAICRTCHLKRHRLLRQQET